MMTVVEYNQLDLLGPFQSLWERLLERMPESCVGPTYEEIRSLDLDVQTKPRVLVALISGRPFGIWPLQVETRETSVGPLRVLTNLGDPADSSAGLIGPYPTAMLTASFRYLHRAKRDWDLIEFSLEAPSETEHLRFKNAFRLAGWRCRIESLSPETDPETNASPTGFRYTHVYPWAFRARWFQFCKKFSQAQPNQQPTSKPQSLTLYSPTN